MPSKKPIIHFNTDQWIIDKMKIIAKDNSRSLAKEMEYLCKQRIKEYENEHGEIDLVPSVEEMAQIMSDKTVPTIQRLKNTFDASRRLTQYGNFNDNESK